MRVTIAYDVTREIISTDIINYTISLQSMPVNSNDSSGSVGSFSVEFLIPLDLNNHLQSRGFQILEGKSAQFDSDYGTMYGLITAATLTDENTIQIECTSYAGGLNAYNVQARPLYTYLGGALAYYFSLGTESVNVVVDPTLSGRVVKYPGWHGELWYHLKLLCAAENINFVLTGQGYVYVEPNRVNEVSAQYQISSSETVDSSNLAQSVSVREYNCEPVSSALFYPRGGWSEEVPVLSVAAGEYTEQTIELAGSMETFQTPTMQTFVSRDHASSSVYTVVAEDGFPIQPSRWNANGGKIEFEIGPDFQTMTVKMQGAEGLFLDNGDPATNFSLALSSSTGGGTYSTLRIVGAGILHENDKEFVVATGIPESVTGTDVGATIDNPFLFDRERVGRAASLAAASFAGAVQTASGTASYLGSGFGVDDVGGRITLSGRPFRIRDVNYTPDSLTFSAEDDLLHSEVQSKLDDMTYGDVEQENSGLTYRNVASRGLQYG